MFGFIVLFGIFAILYYAIAKLETKRNVRRNDDLAINLLRERFAKGNIDEEEYKQKLAVLENK